MISPRPLTFLDLCAGIGGFSLGLERAGMICKGQVEIDDYCTKLLFKHWPHVPKWGDITTLDPACLPTVDLVCGGFPCQPVSQAGKRKGKDDDRWLWPFFVSILAHKRPAWFFGENVVGIVKMELDTVFSDLESLGYEATAFNIPACAVDAPHIRKRIWILAHTNNPKRRASEPARNDAHGQVAQREEAASRLGASGTASGNRILAHAQGFGWGQGRPESDNRRETGPGFDCRHVSHTDGPGHIAAVTTGTGFHSRSLDPGWCQWATEPGICRVVNGLPYRVDRIKGLGNAVVPHLVEEFGRFIQAAHFQELGVTNGE